MPVVIEVIDESEQQQPKRKARKEKKFRAAETKVSGDEAFVTQEASNVIQHSPKTETNSAQVVPAPETPQELLTDIPKTETKVDGPTEVVVVSETRQELSTDTNVSSIALNTNLSQIAPIVEEMAQIANRVHETQSESESVPNATLLSNVPEETEPIVNGALVQTTDVLTASSSVVEPCLTKDEAESFVLVPNILAVSTPSAVSNADVVLAVPVETTRVKDEKVATKQKKRLPTRKSKKKQEIQATPTQAPLTLHVVPTTEEKDIGKVVPPTTQLEPTLASNGVLVADSSSNGIQENHDSKANETKTPQQSPALPPWTYYLMILFAS